MRNEYITLSGDLKGRGFMRDMGLVRRIILKCI
jgi:hypothetical protein